MITCFQRDLDRRKVQPFLFLMHLGRTWPSSLRGDRVLEIACDWTVLLVSVWIIFNLFSSGNFMY